MAKQLVIISGPNGSGKSTFARGYLAAHDLPFLNADDIAFELAPEDIQSARLRAGRIFLKQARALLEKKESLAIESTLAGNYLRSLLRLSKSKGYNTLIVYIALKSANIGLKRIQARVLKGGHPVPEEDVLRRFDRSKINFWSIYRRMVDEWYMFENSGQDFLEIAFGKKDDYIVKDRDALASFCATLEGLTDELT